MIRGSHHLARILLDRKDDLSAAQLRNLIDIVRAPHIELCQYTTTATRQPRPRRDS